MNRDMRNPRTEQVTGAHEGVRPGGLNTPNSTGSDALLHEFQQIHDRAVGLLRSTDPVAVELYELGFRAGIDEGERRAGERAQRAADAFLAYLAEDGECTPRPVPPLNYGRGAAA